jgi:Transport and Golgi organisation 2
VIFNLIYFFIFTSTQRVLKSISTTSPMCTVTFIPRNNSSFVVTSNRDEAPGRKTVPPQKYTLEETQILFPKDEVAGGTWIGVSDKKRFICLLNGGFTAHNRAAKYRMSRGIVVTQLLVAVNIREAISAFNFTGIEPFTIILITYKAETNLFELVWDGNKAHFTEKPLQPHIWSSSLLYTPKMKQLRETWFSEFMAETKKPSNAEILKFHTEAGIGDPSTNLLMDRDFVKTKSITQIQKDQAAVSMYYKDLQENLQTTTIF